MEKNNTIIYGKNCLRERLLKAPQTIQEVFLSESFNDREIIDLLKPLKSVRRVSSRELLKMKGFDDSQGILAKVFDFEYFNFDDLLSEALAMKLSLIFLDRVVDPNNLGAIIRTAAGFGRFAIVIPKHRACPVNSTVLHVASGGENYLKISLVTNMRNALLSAKDKGFWIVGACAKDSSRSIYDFSFPFPLGVVVGSEGSGIRYGVDKYLDFGVHIPMEGADISFNVSMATALICYEVTRQRKG